MLEQFKDLEGKDKVDFYIALAVIVLVGVFISLFAFPTSDSSLSFTEDFIEGKLLMENKNTLIDTLSINGVTYNRIEVVESNETKKPTLVEHFVEEKTDVKKYVAPSYTSPHIQPILKVEDQIITNTDSNETSIKSEIQKLDSTYIDNEKDLPATSTETSKTQSKETECVIIVGYFTKDRNKNYIKKKLAQNGYSVFQKGYKDGERLGVYYPCDNIGSILKDLREKYADDAFILKRSDF